MARRLGLRRRGPDARFARPVFRLDLGAAEQHGISDWLADRFGRSREEVRQDWNKVLGQIGFLLDNAGTAAQGFDLDEITFQLGFSAEGRVVFVAKAGVTTTISAKFTRRR